MMIQGRVIARRAIAAILVGFLSIVPRIAAGQSGEELLEAARTAIQSGDRTGFATLAEGAGILALGVVNVNVAVLRREIATAVAGGDITPAQGLERLETLNDLQSRLAEAKNKKTDGHKDQGKKPFAGRFTSDVLLGPTLPPAATLTLQRGSEFIVNPRIWGDGIANPAVLDAQIIAQTNAGNIALTGLTFHTGSFDINGVPSGPNTASLRPGTTGTGALDPLTGEFQARYEGLLVNNLYPSTNPILYFSEVSGFLSPNLTEAFISTTEPMIVPGVPGQPPIDDRGMAYIATAATFDPASGLLSFGDNLDASLIPDVSLVRTPDGKYVSEAGGEESLVGASFLIDPLRFAGQDSAGRFLFADSQFSIFNASGTFASGQLTDIGIDPSSFSFTADVAFDDVMNALSSSFIEDWQAAPTLQLLGPVATLDLVSATEGFVLAGSSPVDFTNASPTAVTEPGTLLLFGTSLLGLFACAWRYRKLAGEGLVRA